MTAPFGVAYIETRFEALIGAYAAAQLAAEHHARFDAVVVAAFGDPGLGGLREALPCPVTGLTEAALASACLLGGRFSIVAISQRIRAWYRETVQPTASKAGWPASARLDEPLADIGNVQGDQGERLVRAGRALRRRGRRRRHRARRRAAGRPGALACAAACRCRWSTACPARCAMPRRWLALRPARARAAASHRRPIKPNRGLPPAIAALLRRR